MTTYVFGKNSSRKLSQLEEPLRRVARLALSWGIIDFSIVETARNEETQNRLYNTGKSRVQWPHSRHNVDINHSAARAMDAAPYINGSASYNYNHCCVLAGVLLSASRVLGIPLRWGGDWDMDGEPITDQDFQDLVHYERYR